MTSWPEESIRRGLAATEMARMARGVEAEEGGPLSPLSHRVWLKSCQLSSELL